MRKFSGSFLALLTIALAIVLAVLMAPAGSSAFHDALAVGHAALEDAGDIGDDHFHGHDADVVSGEAAALPSYEGDHHKHNPGDHSHEKVGTPPALVVIEHVLVADPVIAQRDPKVRSLPSTFLRPPRPSDIA